MLRTDPRPRAGPLDAVTLRSGGFSLVESWLLVTLLAAPLPLGSISALPRALLTASLCAAAALWLTRVARGREVLRVPPGSLPLVLFVAFVFLQLAPVGALMTESGRQLVERTIGTVAFGTPSLIPGRTLPRALECAALVALFATTASVLSADQGAEQVRARPAPARGVAVRPRDPRTRGRAAAARRRPAARRRRLRRLRPEPPRRPARALGPGRCGTPARATCPRRLARRPHAGVRVLPARRLRRGPAA